MKSFIVETSMPREVADRVRDARRDDYSNQLATLQVRHTHQGEDEATIGFGRVIRHVAGNAGAFCGWGPKTPF